MGVESLLTFLKEYKTLISFDKLSGEKVAVDASGLLYSWCYAMEPGKRGSAMIKARKFFDSLHANNINVVVIFDGASPPWKAETAKIRLEQKKRAREAQEAAVICVEETTCKKQKLEIQLDEIIQNTDSFDTLEFKFSFEFNETTMEDTIDSKINDLCPKTKLQVIDPNQLITQIKDEIQVTNYKLCDDEKLLLDKSKAVCSPTKEDYNNLKKLCDIMKIPIIQAKYETDPEAALLARQGKIYGVISRDSDYLMLGARLLSYDNLDTLNACHLYEYDIHKILKKLELTQAEFTDMCLVSGTDLGSGIDGLACTTIYRGIKANGSIQELLESIITKHQDVIEQKTGVISKHLAAIKKLESNKKLSESEIITKTNDYFDKIKSAEDVIIKSQTKLDIIIPTYPEYMKWHEWAVPTVIGPTDTQYDIAWPDLSTNTINPQIETECNTFFKEIQAYKQNW